MVLDIRLLSLDNDLAERIASASDSVRRQVAATAAMEAVAGMRVDDRPYVADALAALRAGLFGDSPVHDAVQSAAYAEQVASVDSTDRESGHRHGQNGRALLALAYALNGDPETAANEAAYEAMVTTEKISAVVAEKVRAILNNQ